MLAPMVKAVASQHPRIHTITNIVSASLCANGLLAIGAAPIMAEDLQEVAQITAACHGLCLNLGTPNPRKLAAMVEAGKTANAHHLPIVFDPVGVGGSTLRMEGAKTLLQEVDCTVIRGNLSELKALSTGIYNPCGVDAHKNDAITPTTLSQVADFAKHFALETGSIIAISGATDVLSDGHSIYRIANGCTQLSQVSGSGCLLSAIITAYLSAKPDTPLDATLAAMCAMGYCGEQATKVAHGTGSFAVALLDELSNLKPEALEMGAKIYAF